jgi:hypothetical protein
MASNSVGMFQRPVEYKYNLMIFEEVFNYYNTVSGFVDKPAVIVGQPNDVKYIILEGITTIIKYVSNLEGRIKFKKTGQTIRYTLLVGNTKFDEEFDTYEPLYNHYDKIGSVSFTYPYYVKGNMDQRLFNETIVPLGKEAYISAFIANASEYSHLFSLDNGELRYIEPWPYIRELFEKKFKEKLGTDYQYLYVSYL